MSTSKVTTFGTRTTGQFTDDALGFFEWDDVQSAGSRTITVTRRGGRSVKVVDGEVEDGPPETRLAAFQIALSRGAVGAGGGARFVVVPEDGDRLHRLLDVAAKRPHDADVGFLKVRWAPVVAGLLNAAGDVKPEEELF